MADDETPSALERIDLAIARIEAATAARMVERRRFGDRHETLRTRMADAVAALDAILAKGEG